MSGATDVALRALKPLKRPELVLFLLALLLRTGLVAFSGNLGISLDDMYQYDMLGRSLATGDGYRWYAPQDIRRVFREIERNPGIDLPDVEIPDDPRGMRTSFRAPLYPAFLGAIYRVNGLEGRFFAARLMQAVLTASLAPLAYALAKELQAREPFARMAGAVIAFWPLLVALPLALATENLFLPIVAAATLILLRGRAGGGRETFAAGLLFGFAALTRSVIIVVPLLVGAYAWWRGERRGALSLVLPALLLTMPWSIRNSILHGQPTFVETSLGYNLYLGYHPEGTGTFRFGPSLDLITIFEDAARDRLGRQLALGFILDQPGRVPLLALHKLGHFWGLEDRAFIFLYTNGLFGPWPPSAILAALAVLSLPLVATLPLAIFGWATATRDRKWQILTLLIVAYTGAHILVMAEERFHLALAPMVAALAADGLSRWPSIRDRLHSGEAAMRRRAVLAGLLIALAIVNWGWEIASRTDRYAILLAEDGWRSGLHY